MNAPFCNQIMLAAHLNCLYARDMRYSVKSDPEILFVKYLIFPHKNLFTFRTSFIASRAVGRSENPEGQVVIWWA